MGIKFLDRMQNWDRPSKHRLVQRLVVGVKPVESYMKAKLWLKSSQIVGQKNKSVKMLTTSK